MITFYIFKFFEYIILKLKPAQRKKVFLLMAKIAHDIDAKHRKVIRQNLHFVYENSMDPQEADTIERYCYTNLALNFLQVIENRNDDIQTICDKVTIEPSDIAELVKESGRPIILATGHFGNWELAGAVTSKLLKSTMIVYKEMNNRYFQQYVTESRSRFDIRSVNKHGAVKHLVKQLKSGLSISLLVDTNMAQKDGVVVNFFGKPTRTTATTAYLARKLNAIIIPVFIVTDDDDHYTVKLDQPITVEHTDDEENDILNATQLQVQALQNAIQEYPHLWFWCHRRWKSDYPEIYAG